MSQSCWQRGAGFDGTNVILNLAGPPLANYSYQIGPLLSQARISANNSGGPPPANLSNQTFNFSQPVAVGKLFVNQAAVNLITFGVTIGSLPGAPFGEANPLQITANFTLTSNSLVPEPGTAALTAIGLLGLLAMGRRAGRR